MHLQSRLTSIAPAGGRLVSAPFQLLPVVQPPSIAAPSCRKRCLNVANVALLPGSEYEPATPTARQQQQQEPEDALEHIVVPDAPPLRVGDVVYGEVTLSNTRGARVKLTYHGGVFGYMPIDQNPVQLPMPPEHSSNHRQQDNTDNNRRGRYKQQRRTSVAPAEGSQASPQVSAASSPDGATDQHDHHHHHNHNHQPRRHQHEKRREQAVVLPAGHSRPFKVRSVPSDGRGPLLSALDYDMDVLMVRMEQIMAVAQEEMICYEATVVDVNSGGLILSMLGFMGRAFMPWSLLAWRRRGAVSAGWDVESGRELIGRTLEVAITQVVPELRKVVVSQKQAYDWRAKRVLQLGNVLSGTVKGVHPFGAFIRLDALPWQDALLPADCVTQAQRPHDVRAVLREGERVVGLLSKVGDKLQISTMEVEQTPGDMLAGPEARERCFQAVERYIVK